MGERKKEDDKYLREKKQKKKQNIVTIIISVDGKERVLPVKLILKGESFE